MTIINKSKLFQSSIHHQEKIIHIMKKHEGDLIVFICDDNKRISLPSQQLILLSPIIRDVVRSRSRCDHRVNVDTFVSLPHFSVDVVRSLIRLVSLDWSSRQEENVWNCSELELFRTLMIEVSPTVIEEEKSEEISDDRNIVFELGSDDKNTAIELDSDDEHEIDKSEQSPNLSEPNSTGCSYSRGCKFRAAGSHEEVKKSLKEHIGFVHVTRALEDLVKESYKNTNVCGFCCEESSSMSDKKMHMLFRHDILDDKLDGAVEKMMITEESDHDNDVDDIEEVTAPVKYKILNLENERKKQEKLDQIKEEASRKKIDKEAEDDDENDDDPNKEPRYSIELVNEGSSKKKESAKSASKKRVNGNASKKKENGSTLEKRETESSTKKRKFKDVSREKENQSENRKSKRLNTKKEKSCATLSENIPATPLRSSPNLKECKVLLENVKTPTGKDENRLLNEEVLKPTKVDITEDRKEIEIACKDTSEDVSVEELLLDDDDSPECVDSYDDASEDLEVWDPSSSHLNQTLNAEIVTDSSKIKDEDISKKIKTEDAVAKPGKLVNLKFSRKVKPATISTPSTPVPKSQDPPMVIENPLFVSPKTPSIDIETIEKKALSLKSENVSTTTPRSKVIEKQLSECSMEKTSSPHTRTPTNIKSTLQSSNSSENKKAKTPQLKSAKVLSISRSNSPVKSNKPVQETSSLIDEFTSMLKNSNITQEIENVSSIPIIEDTEDSISYKGIDNDNISPSLKQEKVNIEEDIQVIEEPDVINVKIDNHSDDFAAEVDEDIQRSLLQDQELSDDEEEMEDSVDKTRFNDARESLMKELGIVEDLSI